MEYTTLGKTGLKVSVAGLGCGGVSVPGPPPRKTEATLTPRSSAVAGALVSSTIASANAAFQDLSRASIHTAGSPGTNHSLTFPPRSLATSP